MRNNFVAIIKPPGLTSSDVVVRVRNILSRTIGRKIKAGHMGTLDPGAAGVLIVGFDKTNRLFDYLLTKNKSYIARLTFGISTDSEDSFGKIISISNLPTIDEIRSVIPSFIGEINQIPPKYSALKINGQKAYELARKGKEFNLSERKTIINSLDILRYDEENGYIKSIDFKINCASGTYIRTLLKDIASACNKDGYMSYLIRDSVHNIHINDCTTIMQFEKEPLKYLKDAKILLEGILEFYELNDDEYKNISCGRNIKINSNNNYVALTKDGQLKFIAKIHNKTAKSVSNFE